VRGHLRVKTPIDWPKGKYASDDKIALANDDL